MMSLQGNAHLVIMWTVDSDDEGEWDRIFASHGRWMVDHPREGETALLSYTISKGPELSNPMDPSSEATGKLIYVLDEYYQTRPGSAGTGKRPWPAGPTISAPSRRPAPGESVHPAQRNGHPRTLVTACSRRRSWRTVRGPRNVLLSSMLLLSVALVIRPSAGTRAAIRSAAN